jgi:tripartite-type tricarboxylate transporter receptor subunit TctC
MPASADTVADFYRGKSVRLIVGAPPGGAYDVAARIIARHLGRHIPGNPSLVVESMPGAASLILANYLYNRGPRDGTAMGMPNSNILLEPRLRILSRSGGSVQFDIGKFAWLGSAAQEPQVMWLMKSAPVSSFDQLKDQKMFMAATAVGADNYTLPVLLNEIFGAKLSPVTGYQGPADFFIAAERGEVQGAVGALSNVTVNRGDWWREGRLQVLVQFGTERRREIKDVPTAIERAQAQADRQMLEFYALKFSIARALMLPPEVPAERLKALQAAFDATMTDPEFQDEARKLGLELDPINAQAIQRLIQIVSETPEPVVERLRNLISGPSRN